MIDINADVTALNLPVRALNCLNNAGIRTVKELCCLTETRLKHMRNIGRKTVCEIRKCLQENGLDLGITFAEDKVMENLALMAHGMHGKFMGHDCDLIVWNDYPAVKPNDEDMWYLIMSPHGWIITARYGVEHGGFYDYSMYPTDNGFKHYRDVVKWAVSPGNSFCTGDDL